MIGTTGLTTTGNWNRAFTMLLLAAALAAVGPNNADPDIWGHVRYGQEVLDSGQLPRTATHTYTAVGYPWVNHENLAELCFAWIAARAGAFGLLTLKFAAGLTLFGLLLTYLERQKLRLLTRCIVVLLVAVNLTAGWSVRPQLFTYFFYAVMLFLLERAFAETRAGSLGEAPASDVPWPKLRWLLPLLPLFAVWANTHGGFLAGFGVCGLYLSGEIGELVWRRGKPSLQLASFLALFVAACGLVTLINPYGIELHAWLYRAMRAAPPEITEWAALSPHQDLFVPCVVLLTLIVAAVAVGRPWPRAAHLVVLSVVAVQAVTHIRHIAFLALACAFFLGPQIERLLAKLGAGAKGDDVEAPVAGRPQRWLLGGVCVTAALLGMAISSRLVVLRVDRSIYPVDAFAFMTEHQLKGRMVVFFDWAQYALATFAPQGQLQFDGRFNTCYPQEVIDEHFDFLLGEHGGRRLRSPHSPDIKPARILEHGSPELVIVSRRVPFCVDVMQGQADWALLYQDGLAQVWGRRSKYDDPTGPDYFAPSLRQINDRMPSGRVAWPAFSRKTPRPPNVGQAAVATKLAGALIPPSASKPTPSLTTNPATP